MSQQAAIGQGGVRGGGGGKRPQRYFPRGRGGGAAASNKAYESPIAAIAKHTFNTGKNKFAAQFTESRERVAGYIQQGGMEESYLIAETIRTGMAQTIALPPSINANAPDKADLGHLRGSGEIRRKEATETQRIPEEGICYGLRPVLKGGTRQIKGHQGLGCCAVRAVAARTYQKN